jgi:hypothetical protein
MRCAIFVIVTLIPVASADIVATFDQSAEGWTTYNDAGAAAWDGGAGNPAGSIRATDLGQGIYWGFSAGPAFLGDRSDSIDGDLWWETWCSHIEPTDPSVPDVFLISPGLTLVIDAGDPGEAQSWSLRNVHLSHAAGWKVGALNGPAASPAEFTQVMSNLQELRLRAEYSFTLDQAWIDNIVMTTTSCDADCDNSGTLSLFDFLCFVNRFNEGHEYADCDQNGELDLFDFLCFVNDFNQGC